MLFNREGYNLGHYNRQLHAYFFEVINATVTVTGDTPGVDLGIEVDTAVRVLSHKWWCTGTIGIAPPIPPAGVVSYLISASANQNMTDKMASARFDYDTALMGAGTDFYFKRVTLTIPDYTDVSQNVFVGFFPSGAVTYGADGSVESATAYDYAWYLTMQYLTRDNQVFLSYTNQQTVNTYILYYRDIYHATIPTEARYWNVGDTLYGETSLVSGVILENHRGGSAGSGEPGPYNVGSYVILGELSGDMIDGHYFIDNEHLMVNGLEYAHSDGWALPQSTTPPELTISPDQYVRRLLGGDNSGSDWDRLTGISPYRITACAWSDTSDPVSVDFIFTEKTTKLQAIERICKYIRYVFFVKIVNNYPSAYFIPESAIDDPAVGLDLPAMVSVTATDAYLVSPVKLERRGGEKYNKVTVRCQDLSGNWYESVLPLNGDTGEEIPIEYSEINQDAINQAECDQRCTDIYAYYSEQVKTYTATFLLRSDFRLLQKLSFTGVTGVPNAEYRIVGIEYQYADAGATNQVVCTIIADSQFQFWLNLNRVFTDSISEIQTIIKDYNNQQDKNEVGTVLAIDETAGVATIKTESGITKKVRSV